MTKRESDRKIAEGTEFLKENIACTKILKLEIHGRILSVGPRKRKMGKVS